MNEQLVIYFCQKETEIKIFINFVFKYVILIFLKCLKKGGELNNSCKAYIMLRKYINLFLMNC